MRRPPIVAGKYVLTRLVGRGAMGAVYEGVEIETGVRSAIKVIRSPNAHEADVLVARFQREAMAIRAIVSEHVPRIMEAGTDEQTGFHFIAMEFLRGERLDELGKRMDGLSTNLALRIAAQTCAGLAAAHAAGVVHRDVKPTNIFLASWTNQIVVKLLDFGVAKLHGALLGDSSGELTELGKTPGSPRYMSPEQARGEPDVDHRTDIWSLGVVMYEMLAGTHPHGDHKSIGDLLLSVGTRPPRPLREHIRWVPAGYERIVSRAMEMDPRRRYQAARDMLIELDALLPQGRTITQDLLVPSDAMPTSVIRLDAVMPRQPSLPSIFETTVTNTDALTIELSDELASSIADWAKRHASDPGKSEAEATDEDFPTTMMSLGDFPQEVLNLDAAAREILGLDNPPGPVGEGSDRNEHTRNEKPFRGRVPADLLQPGAPVPAAGAPSGYQPPLPAAGYTPPGVRAPQGGYAPPGVHAPSGVHPQPALPQQPGAYGPPPHYAPVSAQGSATRTPQPVDHRPQSEVSADIEAEAAGFRSGSSAFRWLFFLLVLAAAALGGWWALTNWHG